jgi:hypothetical protein
MDGEWMLNAWCLQASNAVFGGSKGEASEGGLPASAILSRACAQLIN